jgi:hypothetical protein
MGKKRKKKCTVYGIVEGDTEMEFLAFLSEIYQSEQNDISLELKNSEGGRPDRIIGFAIRESHRNRSFAWLDEDFEPTNPLGKDARYNLAEC